MPHLPDHQTHDPLLIAALAAGDAEGADLEQARELVAACTPCADLHRDLRAISAAIPATPAPVRTRDFRLSPEQAASIRPAGWRRFLAPLAGPRFAFAAPLGGSLAALGIAGILVASFASAPISGIGSGSGAGASTAQGTDGNAARLDDEHASAAPVEQPEFLAQASAPAPAPQAGGANAADPAASALPTDTTVAAPAPSDGAPGRLSTDVGVVPPAGAEGPVDPDGTKATEATAPTGAMDLLASPFATLAAVLVAAGVVLLGTRVAARRLA